MKVMVILLLIAPFVLFSQILMNDNFNSYIAGEISADLTGETSGQGGYHLYLIPGNGSSTNLNADMATFAPTPNGSQGVQFISPDGSNGQLYMYHTNLEDAWNDRDSGNDVLKITIDFTTNESNSDGLFAIYAYDEDRNLATGLSFFLDFFQIRGLGYGLGDGGEINNYYWEFESGPEYFTPNTMQTFECRFNKTNGKMVFIVNGHTYTIQGSSTGKDVIELNFWTAGGSTNTNSTTAFFDNLKVEAIADDLATDDLETVTHHSFISPNPVENELNITLSQKFDENTTQISIFDANGSLVKEVNYTSKIQLSDLNSGIYILTISDKNTKENLQLIKK